MKKLITILKAGIMMIFLGAALFFCTTASYFIFVVGYAQWSAYSLAPEIYPNSELVGSHKSGGPEVRWDRSLYRTTDDIEQVLGFMEAQMPGFVAKTYEGNEIVYKNYVIDTSRLAQRSAKFACTSRFCKERNALTYPNASVNLYKDPEDPSVTLIQIWLHWPAP